MIKRQVAMAALTLFLFVHKWTAHSPGLSVFNINSVEYEHYSKFLEFQGPVGSHLNCQCKYTQHHEIACTCMQFRARSLVVFLRIKVIDGCKKLSKFRQYVFKTKSLARSVAMPRFDCKVTTSIPSCIAGIAIWQVAHITSCSRHKLICSPNFVVDKCDLYM